MAGITCGAIVGIPRHILVILIYFSLIIVLMAYDATEC